MNGIVDGILGRGGNGATGAFREFLRPELELTLGTSSPATLSTKLYVTGELEQMIYSFADAGNENCFYNTVFPKRWDGGSLRFRCIWTPAGTDTGDVHFRLLGNYAGDGELMPSTFPFLANSIDAGQGTAGAVQFSPWSSLDDWGATIGEDQFVAFRLQRVTGGSDTLTGAAELFGVQLEWTSNAATDD